MTGRPDASSAAITLAAISVSHPPALPTGSLSLAAVLEQAGYPVDFRNFHAASYGDITPAGLVSWLGETAPIVGVSCLSDTLPFVVAAVGAFKALHPRATVILGGPGPTGVARELVQAFPAIDVVVVGEGEETVVELVRCLADAGPGGASPASLRGIRGIVHRDGDAAAATAPRERLRDLDALPLPLYEAIDVARYPMAHVVSARGCPYRCTFCDVAPMWSRRNVRRGVAGVIEEIKLLRNRHGIRYFEFTDETFVLKPDRVLDFCGRLKREGLDVRWSASGRVNLVHRELLAEMASAGCEALFFGIESGSDRVLERVRKDFTVRAALDALHTTLEYMRPVASFIWGFPFETEEDLTQTLLLAVYLSQVGVDCRLNRLAPFPLMPLYREHEGPLEWREDEAPSSGAEPFRVAGYPAEVADLIRRHPRIFPPFHRLPGGDFEARSALVRALGRYWQVSPWPTAVPGAAARNPERRNDGR